MRFVGIDIAAEKHFVAIVDAGGAVRRKPTAFAEDADGYAKLFDLLGDPGDLLVAMEATGHYWKNLFAALVTRGIAVALLNPLRTHRFAGEDLQRAHTDRIDALGIARFAAQKRPPATPVTASTTEELRELVRFRDRVVQDHCDRLRQLHRLVDLGFPEFTRHVDLDSAMALAILRDYPTAAAFHGLSAHALAAVRYDGRHTIGVHLAQALIDAAARSVGQHHGEVYRLQIRYACEDLELLGRRRRALERDIERRLDNHDLGPLLTSIDGIGAQTAARLIAELGDPAQFRSAGALAAHVGVVPATRHSGKSAPVHASLSPIGHRRVRAKLWMPALSAIQHNPWIRAYYTGLVARGKLKKVAIVAAMRKLLIAVYAVAKTRRPFEPRVAAVETQA